MSVYSTYGVYRVSPKETDPRHHNLLCKDSKALRAKSKPEKAPQEEHNQPHISIATTELKLLQQFTYLGCIIVSDACLDKEVK